MGMCFLFIYLQRGSRKIGAAAWKSGDIEKDCLDLNEINLEIAKLSPSLTDINISEEDFIEEGDTIPIYIPEKVKVHCEVYIQIICSFVSGLSVF